MHRRIAILVGSVTALALAGCASPPAPRPTEARAETRAETRVTGSVSYRERIALTPDAVLHVEVVESAPPGGTPSVVGEQTLQNPGQVPIAFSVPVPSERIRPDATYTVRARLTDAGRVFTTPEPVPVLTQGHPSQDVQVRVRSGG
jgi:putative lipoprotein